MSETWVDAVGSEAYQGSGEGLYDSESTGDGRYDSESTGDGLYDSESAGDGLYEGFGEESRSARRQRERQRQIVLARQRQAQMRGGRRSPQPARRPVRAQGPGQQQTITAIRSLDLETKVGQDSLRRALEESNRRASRATWAAVASAAVDQGLSSFDNDLKNHPYVGAGARFAPLLFLAPEKKRGGVEGFVTDPRVIGGAAILGIALLGSFRNKMEGVRSVSIVPPGRITTGGTLTANVLDHNGNDVPGVSITWKSSDPTVLAFADSSSGTFTVTAGKKEALQITAEAGGITGRANVKVKSS